MDEFDDKIVGAVAAPWYPARSSSHDSAPECSIFVYAPLYK